MAIPVSPLTTQSRDRYPIHEEADVPETSPHEFQVRYLRDALADHLPECLVTGNICIYWEPNNYSLYRAPDVLVVQGPAPQERPRVHLVWEDPPVLFVAEIGSRSTQAEDEGPKPETYAHHVKAQEYLYARAEPRQIQLWRSGPGGYELVPPEGAPGDAGSGRLRSVALAVEFEQAEDGFVWVYTPAGKRLLTHEEVSRLAEEEAEQRREAEARVLRETQQRQEAEVRMLQEAQQRQEAELRAAAEARQRQEAEARAADEAAGRAEEAHRRQEAEARAAEETERRQELERQLAELQLRLEERGE